MEMVFEQLKYAGLTPVVVIENSDDAIDTAKGF